MKPFEYNWTTKVRNLKVGSIVVVRDGRSSNTVALLEPERKEDINIAIKVMRLLNVKYGFRVKRLIGPFQHTLGYHELNCNNVNNKNQPDQRKDKYNVH
jgi:hypothetical protein